MSAGPWFKFHHEFATDPVVQLLSFEDQRHFVVLLCLKAGGALDREYGNSGTRERVILSALRIDSVSLVDLKNRLMEIAVIDANWQPTAWEKRQESKDKTAAERMRRKREAERNVTESVTESVTRNVTVGVTRNVTPLEEKRGEEKKNKKREQKLAVVFNPSNVTGLDLTAWADWLAYRQSLSKPLKEQSLPAAAAELAALGDRQAASVRHSIASGYRGIFEPPARAQGSGTNGNRPAPPPMFLPDNTYNPDYQKYVELYA